jgi:class 3 adenylate cyclase
MMLVQAEGRKMTRLWRELTRERFDALIAEYQELLGGVFEEAGGRGVHLSGDSALAAFPDAKQAALAAVAAQRAVAAHDWPHGRPVAISVGVDSAAAGCDDLCDTAEGGQIFVSPATAQLLEADDLGEFVLRDLGEQQTRRTRRIVRAYELVVP